LKESGIYPWLLKFLPATQYDESRPRILKATTDYDKLPRPKPDNAQPSLGPNKGKR